MGGPRRAAPAHDDLEAALEDLDELGDDDASPAISADPPVEAPSPKRWDGFVFTRRHVVAVLVLLACAVLLAVAVMATSSPTPVVVEVPSDVPSIAVEEPDPSPTTETVLLRIHVVGAVAAPGVIAVPEGSIVQDAIRAAGGLTPEADPVHLNLAAPLASGQQIIVGTHQEPLGEVRDGGGAMSASPEGGLVNINTASREQLEVLPGVGPVLAAAIIAWRQDNGGFASVEDLQEVSGIGPKNFEKLKPLVTV